uniref:Uncharacterized protein n=1 Tax=Rhizophora mucronata TaxID=61149 RepID=A0A2P2NRJ8_RHIMU
MGQRRCNTASFCPELSFDCTRLHSIPITCLPFSLLISCFETHLCCLKLASFGYHVNDLYMFVILSMYY